MLDIFKNYATDEDAEINGTWIKRGGAEFLVARMNNRKYAKALETAMDTHAEALQKGDEEADNLAIKLTIELYADHILKGWKSVIYADEDLPYNRENAIKVLSHREFRKDVQQWANDIDNFRAKQEAKAVKN